MKSLYNALTKQDYLTRIAALTPQSKAAWGKMDAPQMMKHVRDLIQVAKGMKSMPSNKFVSFFTGKMAKSLIIHKDKPLPKGIGNEKLPPNDGFAKEKQQLIETLQAFELKNMLQSALPIFGKMTNEDWDKFLVKQLEHHLTQFGV